MSRELTPSASVCSLSVAYEDHQNVELLAAGPIIHEGPGLNPRRVVLRRRGPNDYVVHDECFIIEGGPDYADQLGDLENVPRGYVQGDYRKSFGAAFDCWQERVTRQSYHYLENHYLHRGNR